MARTLQDKKTKMPLYKKLGTATAIGVFSGAIISPAIAIVDRAIIENLSGAST
jgi:hypothetical protein